MLSNFESLFSFLFLAKKSGLEDVQITLIGLQNFFLFENFETIPKLTVFDVSDEILDVKFRLNRNISNSVVYK